MKKILILLALPMIITSCAHTLMRGTVAMKINKNEAHVCLGDNAVKSGDTVAFFKNDCKSISAGGSGEKGGGREIECSLIKLGEGTVSKTLNNHYSLVKTDGTFSFDEGTLVEKATK